MRIINVKGGFIYLEVLIEVLQFSILIGARFSELFTKTAEKATR